MSRTHRVTFLTPLLNDLKWVGEQITEYPLSKEAHERPVLLAARLALAEEIPVDGLVGVVVWQGLSSRYSLVANVIGVPNDAEALAYRKVVTDEKGTVGNVRQTPHGYAVVLPREEGQRNGNIVPVPLTESTAALALLQQILPEICTRI